MVFPHLFPALLSSVSSSSSSLAAVQLFIALVVVLSGVVAVDWPYSNRSDGPRSRQTMATYRSLSAGFGWPAEKPQVMEWARLLAGEMRRIERSARIAPLFELRPRSALQPPPPPPTIARATIATSDTQQTIRSDYSDKTALPPFVWLAQFVCVCVCN